VDLKDVTRPHLGLADVSQILGAAIGAHHAVDAQAAPVILFPGPVDTQTLAVQRP